MRRPFLSLWLALALLSACPTSPGAIDEPELSAVAQKAKRIVETAHAFALDHRQDMDAVQKALADPNGPYRDDENGLYIFMHAYDAEKKEAVCIGQGVRPELVGKNMWYLRTPNGRHLFTEFIHMIDKDGQGWIEYDWLNPYSNKIGIKTSYVKGIDLGSGRKGWLGCGYWKSRDRGSERP